MKLFLNITAWPNQGSVIKKMATMRAALALLFVLFAVTTSDAQKIATAKFVVSARENPACSRCRFATIATFAISVYLVMSMFKISPS